MALVTSSLTHLIDPIQRDEKANGMILSTLTKTKHYTHVHFQWQSIWDTMQHQAVSSVVNHVFLAHSKHLTMGAGGP